MIFSLLVAALTLVVAEPVLTAFAIPKPVIVKAAAVVNLTKLLLTFKIKIPPYSHQVVLKLSSISMLQNQFYTHIVTIRLQ